MKCPNCYNENEAGRVTCKYCGAMLPEEPIPVKKEEKQENTQVPQTESNMQHQENVEPQVQTSQENVQTNEQSQINEQYQQEIFTKQKKVKVKRERNRIDGRKVKKVLIILFVLLVFVGAIAGALGYYLSITSTQKVYQKAIQTILDNTISNPNADAKSFEYSGKMSLTSPESNFLSSLNGYTLEASVGADFNEESSILKVKIDKNGTEYIDATALADIGHRLLYLGESNVYDQYIRVDIPEEYVDQINSMIDFNYLAQRDTSVARGNIRASLETELNKYLSLGTFSRTHASITYNGENKNVRDDIYTITEGQCKNLIKNTCTDLLKDEQFLNSFGEDKVTVEDYLYAILDEVKYLKEDDEVEKPNYVSFHIYTSGLKFEFMGIRVEYNSDFNEEKANILLCKNSDTTYVFNADILANKKERLVTANINRTVAEDGTTNLGVEVIYNQNVYKADVQYKYSVNQGIESLDMSRVKKYEDLKEEDLGKISSNFQELPIYKYLAAALAFIEENEYINELLNANVQTELPNNIKLEDNQSYLITYNNKVVAFEVPTAFENSYSGNMYKSYRKNNRIGNRADIYLNLISEDVEELLNGYIKSYDYLTAKEYKTEVDKKGNEYQVEIPSKYKDVSISEIKTETISDIEYSKVVVKYTTDAEGAHSITYYATKFNDDYTYVVRIEDASEIVTETELEKILKITKYID